MSLNSFQAKLVLAMLGCALAMCSSRDAAVAPWREKDQQTPSSLRPPWPHPACSAAQLCPVHVPEPGWGGAVWELAGVPWV